MADTETPAPDTQTEDTTPGEVSSSAADATASQTTEPAAGGGMSAFIVGYTGEVGKQLVKELARRNTFKKVKLIGRRVVEYEGETISKNPAIEQVQVNFDELEKSKDVFEGLQVGFCCLGTTRGIAGKEGQWKVDHDYAVKTAELAKAGGCKQYHLVTSVGANAGSMFYYNKLKGQTEEDVKAVGIERTSIYRPGMLMCERSKTGATEWISRKLLGPMDYLTPGTMTNGTDMVAKAMANNVSEKLGAPSEVFESKAIHRLATGA